MALVQWGKKTHHQVKIVLLYALLLCAGSVYSQDDPLISLGARATTGPAAGYVEDKVCANCHWEKYQSYQHVGMAKSFARPANAKPIERFGEEFYHQPSKRYYRVDKDQDQWTFVRYQKDADGQPVNSVSVNIDWVVGSGNRSRVYFYQTEWGEMFQLPISWYSEGEHWQMAPGYEEANHPGLHRPVKRLCMFCHNAYPEVPDNSDWHRLPDLFPRNLPEGTGCQRCHGPGANHVRSALQAESPETVRSQIVNPKKLPKDERDAVCFQCHLLPAVSIIGPRRFDRNDYSYRPGQPLADYMIPMEVDELERPIAQRFEINHHAYRLTQTDCYRESAGELTCISCHDPHVKPESKLFRQKVSDVCSACHTNAAQLHTAKTDYKSQACADCHMPTRRTEDVIHVTMTDHRIAKGPFDAQLLIAEKTKHDPIITSLEAMLLPGVPEGIEAEIYRAVATLRAVSSKDAAHALKKMLIKTGYPALQPYLDLTQAELKLGEWKEAENSARYILGRAPDTEKVWNMLGESLLQQQRFDEALDAFKQSLALVQTPEIYLNLAITYVAKKDYQRGADAIDKALKLRPTSVKAWYTRARIDYEQGENEKARLALIKTIALDPGYTSAYIDLVQLLKSMKLDKEAKRYQQLGLENSTDADELKKSLQL